MSNEHWRTPAWLCDLVSQLSLHGIALDPFAGKPSQPTHVVADQYLYIDRRRRLGGGGMTADWLELAATHTGRPGLIYCNPPYCRDKLGDAMAKIEAEAARGAWIVALVAASTDTLWYQTAMRSAQQMLLFKGRLQHVDPSRRGRKRPPGPLFPSALFHWTTDPRQQRRFLKVFADSGVIIPLDTIHAKSLTGCGVGASILSTSTVPVGATTQRPGPPPRRHCVAVRSSVVKQRGVVTPSGAVNGA